MLDARLTFDPEDPPMWAYPLVLAAMLVAVAVTSLAYGSLIAGTLATGVACGTLALAYDGLRRSDARTPSAAARELLAWHRPSGTDLVLVVGTLFAAVGARVAIGTAANALAPSGAAPRATHSIVSQPAPGLGTVAALAVVAVVLAPAIEESLFRGVLQRYLADYVHPAAAIAAVAVTFAALHVPQYGGFCQHLAPLAVPVAVITTDAVLYGVLFHRTGNVAPAALAHGGANALALVAWVL